MADNEAVTNDMAGEAYVENFALKVFTMADNEDRAGKATRTTAKTFLAASLYMELLKIFGNISPEFEDKRKYAKWKAIDITKALKEGRTPVAGPPGGEPELDLQQPGFEENNQNIPGVDQFPGPPSSSDNDSFPIFPLAPTQDYQQKPPSNNTASNVQDLNSSFDQMDIVGKQVAPPLPPKGNDFAGNNNNNNIFDNQFNQQPPAPPPSTNFYDMHQNYQQPLPPQHQFTNEQPPPPQHQFTNEQTPPPPQHPFTNDYAQPHYHQQQQPPPPPHNSFIPPPQAPPQNYIQSVNVPPHQQLPFSAPAAPITYTQSHNYSQSQPSTIEIDPTTVTAVQKYCKFANSALDYNDVKTAVDYLHKALETLEPYNK